MIPKPNTPTSRSLTHNDLLLIAFGPLAFQALWSGIELGVFELLAKSPGQPLAVVAERTRMADQPVEILLNALVCLGLVEKNGKFYSNAPLTNSFLLRDCENSLVDFLGFQQHIVFPGIHRAAASFRDNENAGLAAFEGTEATLYERLARNPELEGVFQRAMASMPSNRSIAEVVPLSGQRHLVDIGGGAGRNGIALARAYPDVSVTIFDSPSVCLKADEKIRGEGLSSRVRTHAGDFLLDRFPANMDCALLAHIGPIWSREQNHSLFKRVHQALPVGGKFYIYNMVTNEDGSGPISAVLGSIYFQALATGKGMVYPASFYAGLLDATGFREVGVRHVANDHAVITAIK